MPRPTPPIVIAHRGASGYRPEHTLASYWLAIRQGADFIEPDLVATRDGVLVARHENEISSTSDVAQRREFAARRTEKCVDGRTLSGFFTEDFSLAELKTLRARERLPELRRANTRFDGLFSIPTFDEVLALARRASRVFGRPIGVYPETKHPTYFAELGLPLEEALLHSLERYGYRGPDANVYIQSFEVKNLAALRGRSELPLIQLLECDGQPYDFTAAGDPRRYGDLTSPDALRQIARYADGIGVDKAMLIPRGPAGELLAASALASDAHAAGLLVHAWTFRGENAFLPRDFQSRAAGQEAPAAGSGDVRGECLRFLELGVDGLFCDQPDRARVACRAFMRARGASRSREIARRGKRPASRPF